MSRVIKQNNVSISDQKRTIQNLVILPEKVKDRTPVETRPADSVLQKVSIEANVSAALSEMRQIEMERIHLEGEAIIAEANAQKESILQEAYASGTEKAERELAERRATLEEEYQQKSRELTENLTAEYAQKYQAEIQELESKMALWLQGMLAKLVGLEKRRKSTIIHLVKMGLQEIALQGDLIIRVSEEDYDYVLGHKEELMEGFSERFRLEVLKDQNRKKNECVIETVMGDIECSLDTQFRGIRDELQLIYESISKNIHS